MRKFITMGLAVSVIILAVLGLRSWGEEASEYADELPKGKVVLELFTSQGCSSCPPAEAVLRKLSTDEHHASDIIPLAFHVDYWNDLGWEDPFSSPEWTDRQNEYRAVMGGATLYTPQIIIQGQREIIGSNESSIRKAIRDLKKEAFNLRFQKASGQLENTARQRQVRRDIARAKTVLGERQNAK